MKKHDQEAARKLKKLGDQLRSGFKGQRVFPAKSYAVFLKAVREQFPSDLVGIRKEQEKRRNQASESKKLPAPKPKDEHERKGGD